jgi:hypothetical protein
MKGKWKIILGIVALLVLGVAGFAVFDWQRHEHQRLEWAERDTTELQKKFAESRASMEKAWHDTHGDPRWNFPGWEAALTEHQLADLREYHQKIAEQERYVQERTAWFSSKKGEVAGRLRKLSAEVTDVENKLKSGKGL